MNENENNPVPGTESGAEPAPRPVRRRRKPKKPPYKALAIFAAIWFVLGLLFGFLLRGCFLDEPEPAPSRTTEPSTSEDVQPTTTAPAEQLPEGIAADDWRLILVNKWNPLDEGYTMELKKLSNGKEVDARCYDDLTAMLDAIEAEDMTPVVCSAYRSLEKQEELFSEKVDKLMDEGLSRQEAEEKAGTSVAVPGTSEHHLGLAVDIVDINNQVLDESQEETPVQKWLMEHCWEYGFILRYPNGRTDVTGIIYEPWHYRYVGKELAKDIYERGLCFEEYLALMLE